VTGVGMDSDWDFLVALATTAVVVATVVLVYMIVTYRRARADEPRAPDAGASRAEADPEPIFFRRYTPGDRE
jgi:hypothetical protein